MKRYKKPFIIAEVGCNHKGDLEIAHEMICVAARQCRVDSVKFQKRNKRELLSLSQFNSPHPDPRHSYGSTYGEHREFLEFSIDQHGQLKEWCKEEGVIYSSSVWDMTSAMEIAQLNPQYIKIPSACNTNIEMLKWLCEHYKGEIHISLGMTTKDEEKTIFSLFNDQNRSEDLVFYACTSGYPVSFEEVCLLEVERICKEYSNDVHAIGFSGHHLGIAVDIAAYTLGAEIVERHFTLDRTWKGTDHAASLEPDGMRRLVRDLNAVYASLKTKEIEVLPIEQKQRNKLKFDNNSQKSS